MEQGQRRAETAWHRLTPSQAAERLGVDPSVGLSPTEIERRLRQHGLNALPEREARPAWRLFLDQFRGFLILVLVAAAGVAGLIGDTLDMVVILAVVVFNALLGFHQERRAGQLLEALRRMLAQHSVVRRGGQAVRIVSSEVVPGDVVLLESGDRVPADGRLTRVHGLEVDESALTGESVAVVKDAAALPEDDLPLGDRINLAFTNTVVTRGRGEMVVTATGSGTEMGRLVGIIQATVEPPTPLQVKLDQLGKRLAAIAGVVVGIILVMGLLRGEPLAQIFLTSVALAVAAIPEGLPAVVTVTLAIGMYRMTRRGAIVKRLAAVESLGATTVICSDKTGTLTLNQMTARRLVFLGRSFDVSGEGYGTDGRIEAVDGGEIPDMRPLLLPALLCNDSSLCGGRLVGDPTEGALLALAGKGGVSGEGLPRIAELPFDPERKFMATFHRSGDEVVVFVKGAPDVLLERIDRVLEANGPAPLDEARRSRLSEATHGLANRALRVLALASRRLPAGEFAVARAESELHGLVLLGLVGIMDPPRPEAAAALADCHRAGIRVQMITGDHRITAAAIAAELGLPGQVLAGSELDRLDDAELGRRIGGIGVIARVAPEHKVRIVQVLRAQGEVVAMTGDGVNDAAALRAADIGVAMGRGGTDVAREAASMVLTDDNFATIVGAVREGRTIYDNIVKFLRFQLSTNIGALLTVFAAPFLGLPVPFNPIQILWVNIIMDGPPAMALAFDPPQRSLMDEPPRRPDEPILTRGRLGRLVTYGTTMMVGTLGVFWHALSTGSDQTHAGTLAFTTFVLFQFFNVFNARVGAESALGPNIFANRQLWLALAAVLALQVAAVHWPPAQAVFHTSSLTPAEWALATAVASTVLILDEGRKSLLRFLRRAGARWHAR